MSNTARKTERYTRCNECGDNIQSHGFTDICQCGRQLLVLWTSDRMDEKLKEINGGEIILGEQSTRNDNHR